MGDGSTRRCNLCPLSDLPCRIWLASLRICHSSCLGVLSVAGFGPYAVTLGCLSPGWMALVPLHRWLRPPPPPHAALRAGSGGALDRWFPLRLVPLPCCRAGSPLVAAGRASPRRALPLMGASVPDLPRVGPAMARSFLDALPLRPVPCSATRLLLPPPPLLVLLSSCSSAGSPNEGGVVALCVMGDLHLPDPPVGCRYLVAHLQGHRTSGPHWWPRC